MGIRGTFIDPGIDWAELIGSVSCKTCTQSSDANDATLAAIPRPPGGGGGGGYENECVTRSTIEQSQTYKIPLTPPMDESYEWTPNPPAGASGVGKNGVPFYPGLDNGGHWVWDVCEADKCNAHVGRGGDYHYHGDPVGSSCVYTTDAYTNNDPHSVKIGYALDGYLIYGRYTAAGQPGIDVDLDLCGGHSHDAFGYHYHPSGCKFFVKCHIDRGKRGMDVGQPNYDNTLKGYDVSSRSDYEDLKPCCSMSSSWAASGITFDQTGNTGKDGTTGTSAGGGGGGGGGG
eukprot:symbB.v1.2.027281.t1/scaffold2789.1/size70278/4